MAHYRWAGRYSRYDADPARITAHLDRAVHYARVSSSRNRAANRTRFGVGSEHSDVPTTVMVGIPDGNWFPAKEHQVSIFNDLRSKESIGDNDPVVHYSKGSVVMSCYRSPLTGGVYLLTYPLIRTEPSPDETVKRIVDSSIQDNNSRGLTGMNRNVRVVEDWRKGALQIHLDEWLDARPHQKFAYFDFMLRTKAAGKRVVYLNELHMSLLDSPAGEVVKIPALFDVAGDIINLAMERDANNPAAIYLIRGDDPTKRYRMSDSQLVKVHEATIKKDIRQRRPGGAGSPEGSKKKKAGSPGGSKKKKAKITAVTTWADVTTVEDAYALLGVEMKAVRTEDEAKLVKSASKKMALKLHPDKGGDEAEFKHFGRAMTMIRDERFGGTNWLNVSYFGSAYAEPGRGHRFGAMEKMRLEPTLAAMKERYPG